jgi:hypothetical protein
LKISLISSSWLRTVAWVCIWESATGTQFNIKIIVFTDQHMRFGTQVLRAEGTCCLRTALKMEAAGSSEMLVSNYQTTQQHIPGDCHLIIHRPKNFKTSSI